MKLKPRTWPMWALLAALLLFMIWFAQALPAPLFHVPYSTVLLDREGQLLSARIAADEQWRFPPGDSLPRRYRQALLQYEDAHFYRHPGVNPLSLLRALRQNLQAGKIVSGGSTLTMQCIRLARQNKARNYWQKALEVLLSIRLELTAGKDEILRQYAAHAPFGGNVVGLEAAAWRYFGRSPYDLSWAEAATLAVLPNAPGLIHPGRNRKQLRAKRDRLLRKLYRKEFLDSLTMILAQAEELPAGGLAFPQWAPHLLQSAEKDGYAQKNLRSSLQLALQKQVAGLSNAHFENLRGAEIHNLAALVLDVKTGAVLAYLGNSPCTTPDCSPAVDIVRAPRSTGSLLKPFLYYHRLAAGEITPPMLVADVPTQIAGYAPQNFDQRFQGAVPADVALARSLNVPAVRQLRTYGLERFYHQLKHWGLHQVDQPAEHYGLSLILGGAESSLWELSRAYLRLAQAGRGLSFRASHYLLGKGDATPDVEKLPLDRGAVWHTLEALSSLQRPGVEANWQEFASGQKIAWKTGTSFGHRDAWAIGVSSEHLVAVWVGNANGEGRPGLTGMQVAGPLLFKIFGLLPSTAWFARPAGLRSFALCGQTGYRAGPHCPQPQERALGAAAQKSPRCPFHQPVFLNQSGQYRVHSDCYPVHRMKDSAWLVLPPVQEYYYKSQHPFHRPLPPWLKGCALPRKEQNMAVVYPPKYRKILVPRLLDGSRSRVVFEVVHRKAEAVIHWHCNETYHSSTRGQHKIELLPSPGLHRMTLVDEHGERLSWQFAVVEN